MKLTHTAFHKNGFSVDEKYYERIKNFDTLIILSKNELSIWQKYHKNVFVIPNFLPQIPQKSTDSAQKVVLSAGRFSSEKGFLRLIDIWHIVAQDKGFTDKEWRLIIVGDGPLKSELESKIKSLNLQDSIILKPFTKEIEREYLGASIYAMASHFEGFGMVLAEASSYALPCIAFDIATGPSDIITHNKSGYLVSDNDLEAYSKHLIALMSDESMRIAFGGEAKRLVGERFSKEVVMEKWEELLRKFAESSEKIH
ncbi:glycosyltransferase [Helicobacter sp. 23-1044]